MHRVPDSGHLRLVFAVVLAPFRVLVHRARCNDLRCVAPRLLDAVFIAHHLTVAAFYIIGLICVAAIRPRDRFEFLKKDCSLAEAFLWLGLYLAINLKISS